MKQSNAEPKFIKCLNPECNGPRMTRGLCHSCYMTIRNRVRVGKATWAALEKAGKILPSQSTHGGTARSKWFDLD